MLNKWRVYRKLPWVRVSEARDCGAAAFASLAAYHRHHLSLEEARALVGTDRDGTTLAGLRDGGRAIGLESRPAQAVYDALGHVSLPAIVHLDDREGHYVILYRWSPTHVVVLDPNRGLRQFTRQAFEAQWSGYLVEFVRTPAFRERPSSFRAVPFFLRLVRPHSRHIAFALALAALATCLGWAFSFFLRVLIDDILPGREMRLLVALGAGLVFVSVLQAFLQFGRLWLLARVGRAVHGAYGSRYIDHLMSLPVKVFDSRCIPGLVMRINQAENVQHSVSEILVTFITDLLMFAVAFGVILFHDPYAALIALSAVPVILLVMVALNDKVYDAQLNSIIHSDELAGHLIGFFDGIRTIKIFSAEERYRRLLKSKFDDLVRARYESRTAVIIPNVWGLLTTSLVIAGVLWYGSTRVMAGGITAGELVVIFGMVAFYLNPVQRLPSMVLSLRNGLLGMKRLEEILALPSERALTPGVKSLPAVRGRIEFDRVSFAYKARRPVLKDVTFAVEPGETVAVVGETGSGKSSLANLVAGFYLPTRGEVRIDGVSTKDVPPEELRRHVSAVFQGPQLFQQSLFENITMLGDASHDEVERAARLASADSFIDALHKGYQSQVSRGGDNFSAGQAQRLALARALLKKAPVLILDEATSSLDGATEHSILRALEENRRERTTIVIAHRLSTVRHADRIVVLHQGEVVEMGTHDELVARRGRYLSLFGWQLATENQPAPQGELVG